MAKSRDANLERLTYWYTRNKCRLGTHRGHYRIFLYNFVQSCKTASVSAYLNFTQDTADYEKEHQEVLKEAFFVTYATTLEQLLTHAMPGHPALRPRDN